MVAHTVRCKRCVVLHVHSTWPGCHSAENRCFLWTDRLHAAILTSHSPDHSLELVIHIIIKAAMTCTIIDATAVSHLTTVYAVTAVTLTSIGILL